MNNEKEKEAALKKVKKAILDFVNAADEYRSISNKGVEDNTTIINTLCYLLYLNEFDMDDVETCMWNWIEENVKDFYEEDEDYWDD